MVLKKTKKRCMITCDRDIWALAEHFLPPGETKSSLTQKMLLDLIKQNVARLVEMIETNREANPKECMKYEEWVMRVGLAELYNEERKKYFSTRAQTRIYEKTDEVKDSFPNIYSDPHHTPQTEAPHHEGGIKSPHASFNKLLKENIHDTPEPPTLAERNGIVLNASELDEYVESPSDEELMTEADAERVAWEREMEELKDGDY